MSGIFTAQQRQTIYETLLQHFSDDKRITGIISMGSADTVFADIHDDVEFLIIIEKPSIIDIVFTLWVKRLEDLLHDHSSFNYILREKTHQFSALLDNYLQISIQFRAVNRFNLVGNDWCVVFDRKQQIQNYLDKRNMTREQYVQSLYEDHVRTIWRPVVSCVRELRRNNLWKANAELELLRKHIAEIAGLRHLQFTQDYQNMQHLPEMFLIQLRHTLPTAISDSAIRRSLKMALTMLFTETRILDEQFGTGYTQQLEDRLSEFVNLYS